jgi:hypothetical protein
MKKVNSPTKKSLYELVRREIDASKQRNANGYALPRETTDMYGFNANQEDNTKTLGDIKKILESTVPPQILQGLEVYATDPASNFVIVNPGIGTIGGTKLYLEYAMTLEIPLELNVDVFYINMANGYLTVDAATFDNKLVLAKVVKQQPQTTFITDIKDSIGSAYIVNYKTLSLKVDKNNKFEEDSLEILRDNIGPVLADNIIGNIRLSEDLKITNTQGTLELNSDSVKILDEDGDIRAKFNRNGTYFYDEDGIETAKFTKDSAHIGNILVTKDSIGSSNFASGTSGFKINDSGYAEFEDVKIRGVLSATTFEKDTISAVVKRYNCWTISHRI